jgi:hypothetical protein
MENKYKIIAVYKFPNNQVATIGYDGEQIPQLQGTYSKELHQEISNHSNDKTKWNGLTPLTKKNTKQ